VLSSLIGSIAGVSVLAFRRGGLKSALPYGTFLALAALFSSLCGEPVVAWYLGLYQ
jgi:leader peptidase (prepilin peptidase)/N-methyltransferase